MLGVLLRFALIAAAVAGAVLLFIYAAVVAVIFIPVALIAAFILRKRGVVRWTTVDLRTGRPRPPPSSTVIDHDPNDVTIDRRD